MADNELIPNFFILKVCGLRCQVLNNSTTETFDFIAAFEVLQNIGVKYGPHITEVFYHVD